MTLGTKPQAYIEIENHGQRGQRHGLRTQAPYDEHEKGGRLRLQLIGSLRNHDGDAEDNVYFIYEFRGTLR